MPLTRRVSHSRAGRRGGCPGSAPRQARVAEKDRRSVVLQPTRHRGRAAVHDGHDAVPMGRRRGGGRRERRRPSRVAVRG